MSMSSATVIGKQTMPSLNHRGRRLCYILLPDGQKVHVVLSPEEAESLRITLNSADVGESFDLIIHGSPEHRDIVRLLNTSGTYPQMLKSLTYGKRTATMSKGVKSYDKYMDTFTMNSKIHA